MSAGCRITIDAADPFVMQYADGFPLDQVAWGRLTLDQLSQQTRIISLHFNIEMLSPYLDQVQSSNAASHVLRTMEQAVLGSHVPGAFGNAKSRTVVVISSDAYVAGLAGLLHTALAVARISTGFLCSRRSARFRTAAVEQDRKSILSACSTPRRPSTNSVI